MIMLSGSVSIFTYKLSIVYKWIRKYAREGALKFKLHSERMYRVRTYVQYYMRNLIVGTICNYEIWLLLEYCMIFHNSSKCLFVQSEIGRYEYIILVHQNKN